MAKAHNLNGISFCISTNSAKVNKTVLEIKSIKKTMESVSIPYEIILAGDVSIFSSDKSLKIQHTPSDAHNGLLAKLRNNAAEVAQYDALVFVDDDLVFEPSWAKRLVEYSENNRWDVLGNRILLPNGGRYWDKATIAPNHQMIPYDHEDKSSVRYQTGCFWIVHKSVYEQQQWDSSIGYYAEKHGGINEDVEYSLRLQQNGFKLSFDKENLIWHNDDAYDQVGNLCLRKQITRSSYKKEFKDLCATVNKEPDILEKPKFPLKGKRALLIGSAPRLEKQLESIKNDIKEFDVVCCINNIFSAKTKELFEKYGIKPDYYFFSDFTIYNTPVRQEILDLNVDRKIICYPPQKKSEINFKDIEENNFELCDLKSCEIVNNAGCYFGSQWATTGMFCLGHLILKEGAEHVSLAGFSFMDGQLHYYDNEICDATRHKTSNEKFVYSFFNRQKKCDTI